jgi:ribosomal protein L40E
MPYLRTKCRSCGHWNRFEVEKILLEQPVSDPKVNAFIQMYLPLKAETCRKCGKCIAKPKELIRITKSKT